ncbi:hypothetical protein VD0004_g3765 [Verticillium dahliae]|uniref:NAD(P)-binding domain-containing protein n=1 Tax=Verticillium dahliae TaxID=27337 RepID=A0A444RY52_VERDA|nr:hypothetical protein VD0004_g3765 [Verticillium dahliae]PNH73863.1 hypothetical protein VD0001_g3721 [Verticillium dahliae]RXG46044.1 hypothetical protein VDGE_03267 [Verticillium dahliae]
MKVLLTGATGSVGGAALRACLAHPAITSIIAVQRRTLPADLASNPKITTVILQDFSSWPDEVLQAHKDAAAMIWAMGTYDTNNVTVNHDYPVAFQEAFAEVLREERPAGPRFRFVLLSGKFVRQDQEQHLYFLEEARKIKGRTETRSLNVERKYPEQWQALILRPGGIITHGMVGGGVMGALLSVNWVVKIDELAAYMAEVAASGEGEETVVENARIVARGKELLEASAASAKPQGTDHAGTSWMKGSMTIQ